MRTRPHGDTTRSQVIEAMGTCATWEDAAYVMGFCGPQSLRRRAKLLGVRRHRIGDVIVVEVKRDR